MGTNVKRFFFNLLPHKSRSSVAPLLSLAAWSALGESLSRGFMLVAFILCAHNLGRTEYGELGLVRTTIAMLVTFGSMGLGLTANRFLGEFRTSEPDKAGMIAGGSYLLAIAAGLLFALMLLIGAPAIQAHFPDQSSLELNMRLCGVIALFGAVSGAQIGILQGLQAYRSLAMIGLIQGLLAVVALPMGAQFLGVTGATYGILLFNVVGFAGMHFSISRELKQHGISINYRPNKSLLPLLLKFSIPSTLAGILVAPFRWVAETNLASIGGFSNLALFSAAMVIATALLSLVNSLNAPLITFFSGRTNQGKSDPLIRINVYGPWYVFLILSFPLVVVPELASIVVGSQYDLPAFHFTILFLLSHCGLMLYYSGIVRLMIQNGNLWLAVATNLVEGIALLAAYYFLRQYDAMGLAVAYVISYVGRIVATVPLLKGRGIVSRALLLDKAFLCSAAGFALVLLLSAWRLS
jgi:O-antigen/teichoic acid export membrane protein